MTQGDAQLDAMRTLAHAYRYLDSEAPTFATLQTQEYWDRNKAAMLLMQHFYVMAKHLTMYEFLQEVFDVQ